MPITGGPPDVAHTVRVYRNIVLSPAHIVWTAIPFTHQRWDDPADNQWAVAPNPTQLVCQRAGPYVISAHLEWAANAIGQRILGILLGGATWIAMTSEHTPVAAELRQSLATVYKLAIGNFVEMVVWQDSGLPLAITSAGNYTPEFAMVRSV